MPSTRLGSDKYQFLSHWFHSSRVQTREVWIPRSPRTGDGRSTYLTIPSDVTMILSGFNQHVAKAPQPLSHDLDADRPSLCLQICWREDVLLRLQLQVHVLLSAPQSAHDHAGRPDGGYGNIPNHVQYDGGARESHTFTILLV